MLDLIIRNGKVVDGTGLPAYTGDIRINNVKIVITGSFKELAKESRSRLLLGGI